MTKTNNHPMLFLQLFAETASDTGVTALDAGVQGVKQENTDAAAQTSETNAPDRNAEFERLIKGEFKDLYNARVQDVVRRRLKSQSKTLEQYQALEPTLELLAKKYGVAPHDPEALSKAIQADDSLYQQEADRRGLTVSQLRQLQTVEQENAQLKAQRQYDLWLRQAEQAKQLFPSLQLRQEVQDSHFRELLSKGLSVEDAYLLRHRHEIIPAAMQYSAKAMEQKLANRIAANGVRPPENGMGTQGAAVVKNDISQMTRAQRQDIIRRVRQGEIIRF